MADLLKFKYVPLQAGYSAEVDTGIIMQQLDGGAPRFRVGSVNNTGSVACNWKLDELGYQYAMAFYRIWCRTPSKPFHVEMFLDDPEVKNYTCWFVPNSLKLTSKNGLIYNVSAQLIVESQQFSYESDKFIVDLVTDGDPGVINPIEKIANVDMPEHLGVK